MGETRPSPIPAAPDTVASPTPQSLAAGTRPSPVPERADAARTQPSPLATGQGIARTRPAPDQVETCEIVWWRGFVKSQFYAALTSGDGESVAVETSPLFRGRGDASPEESEEALAAHRTLVELLRADGWEQEGRGVSWYALRFRRPRPT